MKSTTIDGFTFWTKTIATLKREAHIRRNRLYEAAHAHDRVQLISAIAACGFLLLHAVAFT